MAVARLPPGHQCFGLWTSLATYHGKQFRMRNYTTWLKAHTWVPRLKCWLRAAEEACGWPDYLFCTRGVAGLLVLIPATGVPTSPACWIRARLEASLSYAMIHFEELHVKTQIISWKYDFSAIACSVCMRIHLLARIYLLSYLSYSFCRLVASTTCDEAGHASCGRFHPPRAFYLAQVFQPCPWTRMVMAWQHCPGFLVIPRALLSGVNADATKQMKWK